MFLKLAIGSLLNRRLTVLLTVLSIMFSTIVVLGAEHLRQEIRNSFSKTVSGVDLIVGARTGGVNLLLYSVFHIGNATNNVTWKSYQEMISKPGIAWSIPISLGDSHRGYRVLGTTSDYFRYFKYGSAMPLHLQQGSPFEDYRSQLDAPPVPDFKAVLGAEVAARLGYQPGHSFVVAHGLGSVSFANHTQYPFTVTGILAPTGTPVDQTIHISLESLEAVHRTGPVPDSITAFMIGLESKLLSFRIQREINEYRQEPLIAIMPGVVLAELWQMMNILERVLTLIAGLVLVSALFGMATMLLSTLQQRERELAVLRALGARPGFLFLLIQTEALLMTLLGLLSGIVMLTLILFLSANWISASYGLFVSTQVLTPEILPYLGAALLLSFLLAGLPATLAYRRSLAIRLSS